MPFVSVIILQSFVGMNLRWFISRWWLTIQFICFGSLRIRKYFLRYPIFISRMWLMIFKNPYTFMISRFIPDSVNNKKDFDVHRIIMQRALEFAVLSIFMRCGRIKSVFQLELEILLFIYGSFYCITSHLGGRKKHMI